MDVLYADRSYVALHTVRAGVKTVRLPRRADVWEVFTERQVGRECVTFQDGMSAGGTHLYYGPARGGEMRLPSDGLVVAASAARGG
ncbi:MAG: hypothetical protein FJZ90_07320 [Chloroflexi bacterium]|nr:hypothetical protein [Chloroflexota bacterium]